MFRRDSSPLALRSLLLTAFCLLLLLLAPGSWLLTPVLGQSATATLSGTVEDTNGAIIPGVRLTLANVSTKASRQATTNSEGSFVFPLLPPSSYTLTAEGQGFAPIRVENIVLNVGDQKALQIQLKAGDVNAQVTIDSDAEMVRTDGGVGTVINRQFVSSIPLNGRSLQGLMQLVPGVVLTTAQGQGATGSTQFSVNGQRTTSNYFVVDGVSANTGMATSQGGFPGASGSGQAPGTTALGGTNSLVSLDALQEFRIETSTFAPEFGRTTGGQISLVTRGGTNQFHGSASYYFRNEALDANDWFANATRQPRARERQSFFGGTFGGPFPLLGFGEGTPMIRSGKDRAFFFFSYEGLRLQQPRFLTVTVPTSVTRAQAVAALKPYLNALPLPNGQDFGNGTASFNATYSDPGSFNVPSLRLDANITRSLTSFFRFSHAVSETDTRRTTGGSTIAQVRAVNDSYTGGVTWTGNQHLIADARINWTRNATPTFFKPDTFGGAIIPNISDVFLPGRTPENASSSISILTPSSSWSWGPGVDDVQRQFNIVGNVNWSIGAHQLKFGLDYRRLLPLLGGGGQGTFENLTLSNVGQSQMGQITRFQVTNADGIAREAVIPQLSTYLQDTWRVNRRLTLTYGLRLDRVPPPSEATGRPPRTLLGIDTDPLTNPRLAPEGTPLFRSRFGYVAPRFGIAYQLSTRSGWETSLRGGVGVFYDSDLGDVATAFSRIYPYSASKTLSNVLFTGQVFAPPALGVDPPQQFWLLDPNWRMPYTVQWNSTWEQGLGRNQSVTMSYVGSMGRKLLGLQEYVQPLADWPTTSVVLQIQRNLSRSEYNALQIKFERRLIRGLQALASYTFGRSEDNISVATSLATPINRGSLVKQNWGPSDFDVRHVFSAGVSYDLPKVSKSDLLRATTSGWGIDLLIRYQSAFPVTPTAGFVVVDGQIPFSRRPNLIPGVPLYIDDPNAAGGRIFNNRTYTAADNPILIAAGCVKVARDSGDPPTTPTGPARGAFCSPQVGQQGNFERNGLRGFPASQVDLALRREIRFSETVRLQLRAEIFNLFNHPNFSSPQNAIDDGNFGKSLSMLNRSLGGLNALYQMGGPRSGELAVKIIF